MGDIITCEDILGKEVILPDARVLGIATKLYIDKNKKKIVGISVDTGFMRAELFVGIKHIKKFGKGAIFLSTYPFELLKGKEVVTTQGRRLGKVRKVKRDNKEPIALIIETREGHEEIDYKKIVEIGDVIVVEGK